VALAILLAALATSGAAGFAFVENRSEMRAPGGMLLPAESELVRLVNEFRALFGLSPLGVNSALCRASRVHAEDMAAQDTLSHVLDGRGPTERALAEGFAGPAAENIAAGDKGTPRAFFDLWLASEPHRATMLSLGAGDMGAGCARSETSGKVYCAAMFGVMR
jgi:uncharacterized protein YkwD